MPAALPISNIVQRIPPPRSLPRKQLQAPPRQLLPVNRICSTSCCAGLGSTACDELRTLLEIGAEPLSLIDAQVIPALNAAGQAFEKGKLFLPQLLLCAEAATQALDLLKEHILRKGECTAEKGRILLATVRVISTILAKTSLKHCCRAMVFPCWIWGAMCRLQPFGGSAERTDWPHRPERTHDHHTARHGRDDCLAARFPTRLQGRGRWRRTHTGICRCHRRRPLCADRHGYRPVMRSIFTPGGLCHKPTAKKYRISKTKRSFSHVAEGSFAILSGLSAGDSPPLLRFRLQSISIKKSSTRRCSFFRNPWFRLAAGPTLPGTFLLSLSAPAPWQSASACFSFKKSNSAAGRLSLRFCAPA